MITLLLTVGLITLGLCLLVMANILAYRKIQEHHFDRYVQEHPGCTPLEIVKDWQYSELRWKCRQPFGALVCWVFRIENRGKGWS